MLRKLYTSLLYLLVPLVLVRLYWRGRQAPAYRLRWRERFGFNTVSVSVPVIWVHCVSVGETIAALPLLRELLLRYPGHRLMLTTTTPTGSAQVVSALGDQVDHSYMPYDLPGSIKRFLNKLRPELVVILETEIWPNLFAACAERQIPLAIINARLSPASLRGYLRIARLVRQTLTFPCLIAAQSQPDADRFLQLETPSSRVKVTGNIKFDMDITSLPDDQIQQLRNAWHGSNPERLVWIAASTHQGEDEIILAAFARVRQAWADALLILVPRHPERFDAVAELSEKCARQLGGDMIRRSSSEQVTANTAIFLGDTMGELRLFYAAADVAFVGGSLVKRGGHNILEPAAQGLPVIFGPHMFNFMAARDLLLNAQAGQQIDTGDELASAVLQYAHDKAARLAAGRQGQSAVNENRGALQLTLAELALLLPADTKG